MAFDLLGALDHLDDIKGVRANKRAAQREDYVRAPFGYPGGKSRAIAEILPHLPYRKGYCEPFGGGASILLARRPTNLDIYNDRYGGVVAFYRCIRDRVKLDLLINRLDQTVASREEFHWCKNTWETCTDDVERAARWYYMHQLSFASLERNFGRQTSCQSVNTLPQKITTCLKRFPGIHQRFKSVTVENLDWKSCMVEYDSPDMVFYCDPPYLGTTDDYLYREHSFTEKEHIRLLDWIFECKGFVALSGYDNELYNNYAWNAKHTWDQYVSMSGGGQEDWRLEQRKVSQKETLWIKESR